MWEKLEPWHIFAVILIIPPLPVWFLAKPFSVPWFYNGNNSRFLIALFVMKC